MKLHETKDIEVIGKVIAIMRVPGGWIYTFFIPTTHSIFIPFNSEFEDKEFEGKESEYDFPPLEYQSEGGF